MSSDSRYFAHSAHGEPEVDWQLLSDHLIEVGRLAAVKAAHFDGSGMAECAGLLHDLGKYCAEFQARLLGSSKKVDHATWGAKVVVERYGQLGTLLAYAIAGHHAGLADGRESEYKQITPLEGRLERQLETRLDPIWKEEIALAKDLALPNMSLVQGRNLFQLAFLGRMIFSCLVDADFLDTEAFYNRIENQPSRDNDFPSLQQLRDELDRHLAQPRFQNREGVNQVRADILQAVRQGAEQAAGLFSLNVPTGGGKTLTSLAFALDHAIRHGQRRVILVIPFTSIVEQNAAVFREALGEFGEQAVLEHHSAFTDEQRDYPDPDSRGKLRQAAENWEAPIVVTTAVQFFESLFANRSSRCRKLHNIANSVVILDEAQTLPLKLLKPCVAAMSELALNYRSSLVLCTATQPALLEKDGFSDGLTAVRELAPDPADLHRKLERVTVIHVGALGDDALAEQLLELSQVLCIVNNRRHARSLYEQIRKSDGSYHLTTLMCARHRSEVLQTIRERLVDGLPCRVVSTSLIEAGVDVDFPQVFRAEAGLDSIAQAAGRCNREGRRDKTESKVSVFTVASDWSTPPELEQYAQACRAVFRKHGDNPLSLIAIRDYFQEVYWLKGGELDAHGMLATVEHGGIDGIPYEQMARQFQMIESNMKPVIVRYTGSGEAGQKSEISRLLDELAYAQYPGKIAKHLQRYLVQIPEYGFKALAAVGAIQPINKQRFGEQFMELVKPDLYDPKCGLTWDDPTFVAAEQSVM
jgi:CRISPR-associated endonuclease/helicase Cas3